MSINTEQATAASRRSLRSDNGSIRLTARDAQAMAWLEDMRSICITDFAVLLGRLSVPVREPLSVAAATAVVTRWRKLGIAKSQRIFAREAAYIWLTEQGARLAGAEWWKEPGWSRLPHEAMVARTRLYLEASATADLSGEWFSERRFRQEHYKFVEAGSHCPDGEIVRADGSRVAIEVELSDKGPARTINIVKRAAGTWPLTLYVVRENTQTAKTVRGAIRKAMEDPGMDWMGTEAPKLNEVRVIELPAVIS